MSYVYFIQAGPSGPIKIGKAHDPWNRRDRLQTGSPALLVLTAAFKGGQAEERKLHDQFQADRLHGEWFRVSDGLQAMIDGYGIPEQLLDRVPGNPSIWRVSCSLEPRLQELWEEAEQYQELDEDGPFCANRIWYGQMRRQMIRLVGHGASHPYLKSSKAYQVAYDKIYNTLPNCRGCSGIC